MRIEESTPNKVLKILVVVALSFAPTWGQDTSQSANAKLPTALSTASVPGTASSSTGANLKDSEEFLIGNDDVLAISVWKEPEVSRAVPVRSDGKISLPLVGELQASGQTPRQLEEEISKKLQSYISEPEVTVIVQEIRSQRINILGEVTKPGSYVLTSPMTVLDAIARAGGFRDFAKQKSIYILREGPDGAQTRIPFNYKQVIKAKNSDQNIGLKARDTIIVP